MRCRATGKVMHATRDAAMIAAKQVKAEKRVVLEAYLCRRCRRWHLGGTPDTNVQNMNAIFDRIAGDLQR